MIPCILKPKNSLLLLLFVTAFASCKKELQPKINPIHKDLKINKQSSINLNSNEIPTNPLFIVDSVGKNIQFFKSTFTPQEWRQRMKVTNTPTQVLPTGFYLKPNTTLTYKIELISGTEIPKIFIGTYSRTEPNNPRIKSDNIVGSNTLTDPNGGLIWIEFNGPNANSQAKITFENGHSKVPVFIKNKTTQQNWQTQINNSDAAIKDVLMLGNRTVMVYSMDLHPLVATQDNNKILNHADFTMDFEDELAGFDDLSYNHTKSPVPHLMVDALVRKEFMAATSFRTYYRHADGAPTIFSESIYNNWGLWHEIGHMHQQSSTTYRETVLDAKDGNSEVTVNIFSLAVEKALGITPNRLQRNNIWPKAIIHINSTANTKDYDLLDVWTRLVMFHQLTLAYGNEFYIKFHRSVREDNNTYSGKDPIKRNIIKKASLASGYNLSSFFIKWTYLPENDPIFVEIAALNLAKPIVEPYLLTDTYQPVIENGAVYQIQTSLNSSKVIDVNSSTPVNYTKVSLWNRNNPQTNNQKFLARVQNDGTYVFKSLTDTTKVLDVSGGVATNGTQIIVFTYNGTKAQKWTPIKTADNLYNLKSSVSTNSYLEVENSNTANGTKIQIWSSNNGNNQKFKLLRL